MGYNTARDLADYTDTRTAISQHLQYNHYPPVPLSMVEPCLEAIDAYWDEDIDREIDLPAGVLFRGEPTAPAHNIISAHHLEAFLETEDED